MRKDVLNMLKKIVIRRGMTNMRGGGRKRWMIKGKTEKIKIVIRKRSVTEDDVGIFYSVIIVQNFISS